MFKALQCIAAELQPKRGFAYKSLKGIVQHFGKVDKMSHDENIYVNYGAVAN